MKNRDPETHHSESAVILYITQVPDTRTLGYAFLTSPFPCKNLIKTFSKGLHQRAISYRQMRARVFGALDEKMCSILFSVDLSLSGSALGTEADKSNFSLIWWKPDTLSDMVTAP